MQRTSINDLVKKAKSEIEELSVEELKDEISEKGPVLVDIRDFRERLLEGTIPGAISAPRGMIEWWFDPDSPYHKAEFTFGNVTLFLFSRLAFSISDIHAEKLRFL